MTAHLADGRRRRRLPASTVFSRAIQPATVTASSFTLTGPGGAVPATVSYDDQTSTATLVPAAPLAYATTYTARLTTAVTSTDGMTLPAPIVWTFTTTGGVAPQVVDLLPADGTADVGPAAIVRGTFDIELAAGTVNATTVTLTGPGGPVTGAVSYTAGQRTATLVPDAPLAPGSYTARLDGSITAADGAPLQTARTWTFTIVAAPPALAVAPVAPAAGATGTSRTASIQVAFNRSIDPSTLTASSFRLRAASSALVAGTIAYDANTRVATLTPAAALDASATYTVEVSTDVLTADLAPLPALASWTFTTTPCPCRLMDGLTPNATSLGTSDGRGSGTFTYEMGTRIQVTAPSELTAIRFYKSPGETGTHVATLWSSTGAVLAQATFANETPAGWQSVALETPVQLTPGTTYTVSVGLNEFFVMTTGGLAAQRASGALQSVVGGNGVFGLAAGTYPTLSYNDSNYFVDAEIG
ncbi:MAG: Ig-like domain-containing protein [Thermoleophilia bacterium]